MNLSHREIEELCRQCFKIGHLQNSVILTGGAVNTTYKIQWNEDWFVLRIYTREESFASIEKEVCQLVQAKVRIPEMIFFSEKKGFYYFALFRFYPWPHVFEVDKIHTQQLSYDLGNALGKIHSVKFPQAGLFGKDLSIALPFDEGSSPYYEYCIDHFEPETVAWKRLGSTQANQVLNFLKAHKDFFPVIHDGGCLVHSDFKPVNLLWDEKEGLLILDWEFAHCGDALIDFAILLRHENQFPLDISSLENGYKEQGRDLPTDWIKKAHVTDFINIIQLLNAKNISSKLQDFLIDTLNKTIELFPKKR